MKRGAGKRDRREAPGEARIVWESPTGGRIEAGAGGRPFFAAVESGIAWVWLSGRAYRIEPSALPAAAAGASGGARTIKEESTRPSPTPTPSRSTPRTTVAAGPGAAIAPLPGRVLRVLVEPDDRVEAGALLLTISAMKMEHEVRAPARGRVSKLLVRAGDRVEAGDTLLEIVSGP